jgi:hypothetical protein
MGCCGKVKEWLRITPLSRRNWPEDWIKVSSPGDLLLLGNHIGKGGSILRLKHPGSFMLLNEGQTWRQEIIRWPFAGDRITGVKIMGREAEVIR